ncbi:MAG: hypothetical protein ACRCZ2_08280, partial [Fusobacteriaceae bacterium]
MKRLITVVALILFFIALFLTAKLYKNQKNNNEKEIPVLAKFYENTKIKKIQKEIGRKVYSKNFQKTVKDLDLKKLEAINYLVGRDSLSTSLNSEEKVLELKKIENSNITSKEAEKIFLVSKELAELESITPELKSYLQSEYRGFDYRGFAKKGDNILSYIRNKELIRALLPKSMGDIISKIPPAKAEVIMEILEGREISSVIGYTTNNFIKLEMTSEEMNELYLLSSKLYRLGEVEPKLLSEANKL